MSDRDPRAPCEGHPHVGQIERERTDIRVVSILAALALCVAIGLWFYTSDKEMVSSDGTTVQTTTGSGSQELPLPNAPSVPAPTPPQQ